MSDGIGVSLKPEPTAKPIQPEIDMEPQFETTPIEPIGNSDKLFDEYMVWIKKQRMSEQPFGAMSLEIDLIDKFESYKVWAVKQIKIVLGK